VDVRLTLKDLSEMLLRKSRQLSANGPEQAQQGLSTKPLNRLQTRKRFLF
jgi:hypothetical protein